MSVSPYRAEETHVIKISKNCVCVWTMGKTYAGCSNVYRIRDGRDVPVFCSPWWNMGSVVVLAMNVSNPS